MIKNSCSVCDVALALLIGMAAGAAATYVMSGDAVLLRRNIRKVERSTHRALRQIEKNLK